MHDDPVNTTSILVCGLLAADIVFDVATIPKDAIKYRANNVSLSCGGGGCYAAIAIKRLGGIASILARVGDDDFGKFILSTLNAEGIDCANVSSRTGIKTPVSSIAIDSQGERQILNYRDQAAAPVVHELSFETLPLAVLVDTRWHEGSIYALEYAKAHNIPGIVDAEAPVSLEAMSLASHIAFSRQGLSDFASTDSIVHGLLKASVQFSAWICVTDGENGTHILRGPELETIPAPKIDAVDTLGAGDVWHGAFAVQLARGADELSAVKFANITAALKCARAGGGFAAPTLREVVKFSDVHFV
jgi:sulfofructose kinase